MVSTDRLVNICIGWPPIAMVKITAKDEVTLEAEAGIAEIEAFLADRVLAVA